MLIIKNQWLEIQIDSPGEIYNQSRFDWTGQISQIILNGKHTFCTTETNDERLRKSRGIGMCNEFGISTPVGYDECPAGHNFLKIGVGLLLKESNEPYDFFKTYKVKPASFEVSQEEHSVTIVSKATDNRGYAFELCKKYEIVNSSLLITCSLKNSGSKQIKTEEYCHNFVAIDARPVDGSYRLTFGKTLDRNVFTNYVNPEECTIIAPSGISWKSIPESDFFFSNLGEMNTWKLENTASQVSINESLDFVPAYSNLWGKGHVISPEMFKEIDLAPGKTESWTRKYEFNNL